MNGNKRHAERVNLASTLDGEVLVPQPMLIAQISRAGMQVETAFPLQLGSLHDFRLTLAAQSLVVKGRVVHSRISEVDRNAVTYLSGIEFVDVSLGVATVIAEYVDSIRRQRGGGT
jgi:hypothetical protein